MTTLLDPWMLFLILLVPAGLLVRARRGPPALRFAPAVLLLPCPATWRTRTLWVPSLHQGIGLALLVIALARPVFREPLALTTEGVDIVLCIDCSSSMIANDLDPRRSRLEVALKEAGRFVEGRPYDRIGLIGFARYPDLVCPPTTDHKALNSFLETVQLVEQDGPEDATAIGAAVARAAQVLSRGKALSRVVILLTDGEENVSTSRTPEEIAPIHAAQLCREMGVKVYTIMAGIGNPDQNGRFNPLDASQVRNLAEGTGGRFYEARDAGAVSDVYARIDELEKVTVREPRFRITDQFLPFLIAGLALILLGRLLEVTVWRALP